MRGLVSRWHLQSTAKALVTWQAWCVAAVRGRVLVGRLVVRWQSQALAGALDAWKVHGVSNALRRRVLAKMVGRLSQHAVAAAFHGWCDSTAAAVRLAQGDTVILHCH